MGPEFHFNLPKNPWRSGAGGSEKPPVVKQREINRLEEQQAYMESFLALEQGPRHLKELTAEVRGCFTSWQALMARQQENEWAKTVLAAFERQGKIKDLLEEARSFADGMDSVDGAETARKMGYGNHLIYLRHQMAGLPGEFRGSRSAPPLTRDNVAQFIRAECASVASLAGLPKARETARELLAQLRADQPKTDRDKKRLGEVSGTIELLDIYSKEDISELRNIRSSIEQRTAAMKENFSRGSALFRALTGTMTDAWFDAFDPQAESSPVKTMELPELQAFYKEKLAEVLSKLNTGPK